MDQEQEIRYLKGVIIDLQHQLKDAQETVKTQASAISKMLEIPAK
jgi:hypothetical protein